MSKIVDITEPDFLAAYNLCKPATMTSIERMYALFNAVRYVIQAGIPGAFAECGVWKGGSVMMIAYALRSLGVVDRDIYLYDTFEGMTPPTPEDLDFQGRHAGDILSMGDRTSNVFWAYSPIEQVRANLQKTGYPMERFVFVRGDVLQTIPAQTPKALALLRLDTDWYESTKHELLHLFPKITQRGVLIIDDYGHFQGARKAVDEYMATLPTPFLMHRVDYTSRVLVKS